MRSLGGRISFGGRWGDGMRGIGINVVCIYMWKGGGIFAQIWPCLANPPRIRERITDR